MHQPRSDEDILSTYGPGFVDEIILQWKSVDGATLFSLNCPYGTGRRANGSRSWPKGRKTAAALRITMPGRCVEVSSDDAANRNDGLGLDSIRSDDDAARPILA